MWGDGKREGCFHLGASFDTKVETHLIINPNSNPITPHRLGIFGTSDTSDRS